MKKQLLLYAVLIFVTTETQAQTSVYYQFPDSNAFWYQTVLGYNDTCDVNEYYSLSINGDTTIKGNLYQKIIESGFNSSSICDTTVYFNNVYIAAIRQNASLKEVFVVPNADSAEMLLYDFNLKSGDTLPATYLGQGNYNHVVSVDSVLIGANYRKSFAIGLLDSTYSYVTLIQGIGSSFGLIAPMSPPSEYYYSLSCFSQNGQTLYPDSRSSCNLPTGVKELQTENSISLYPDPVREKLTVGGLQFPVLQVDIYNVLGQVIRQSNSARAGVNRKLEIEIDVSSLPSGIYFLQLKSESGSVVKKFIKE